jgi:hypothetical protein
VTDDLTDDDLRLVLRHGGGRLTRAVAAVKLMKREGRIDELEEKIDTNGGTDR